MNIVKIIKNYESTFSTASLYRMMKGVVRARLLKKNTLRAIELYPTFSCQMKCKMCSVERYKKNNNDKIPLSMAEYADLARAGARLGATTLIILGGEPTLFPHLHQLIRIFHEQKYFVHIVTNGISLTQEYARQLKDSNLNSIFFSLDSMDPVINDEIRLPGHFAKTMQNIKWCQEEGLEVGLAPVFFSSHINQALDVVDFCHKNNLRASGGQIAPTGKAKDMNPLTTSEIDQIRKAVDYYPNFVFDWSFSYFKGIRCPAGKEKIGITMYGDVVPCSYNPISFGNIKQVSLKEILVKMGKFSQFSKDYEGCMCSEDPFYLKKYLEPAVNADEYPLDYREHPEINPESEPSLFL